VIFFVVVPGGGWRWREAQVARSAAGSGEHDRSEQVVTEARIQRSGTDRSPASR